MLNKLNQRQLYDELYLLQNCELALGAFYQELIIAFPGERFFWEQAVSDEVNHARWIGQLIAIVSSDIEKYALGQYRSELLKTYIEGLYLEISKIRGSKISRQEILTLVQNYERTKVEQRPFEVVKSYHSDYLNLVAGSMPQIEEHTNRIQAYARQKAEEPQRIS